MYNTQGNPQERYLSPIQVADLLKVSPVTVRHWALLGKLKCITTPGGHRRFQLADVEQFAQAHGVNLARNETAGLRVLIVDDNQEMAAYLSELLSMQLQDISVAVACDGFDAGEKIHTFKPNVVLLDLMMPGLDGFETCRRIKQNERADNLRVIAMTGYPSEENIQRILSAGAEMCLEKPIRAPTLLEALGITPFAQQAP